MSASAALPRFANRPLAQRDLGVCTEARRVVRLCLRDAAAHSEQLLAAATSIPESVLDSFAMKGTAGRARARQRILAAMPKPPLASTEGLLIWRHCVPRDHPLTRPDDRPGAASLGRDVLEVVGMAMGRLHRGGPRADTLTRAHRSYGLCVTDHALGRCAERCDMDPLAAVLLGHDALMTASAGDLGLMLGAHRWAVPAGDAGAWLCTVLPIIEDPVRSIELGCSVIGGTFVSRDLLTDEQAAQCRLLGRRPPDYLGAPLGLSVLRPPITPAQVLQ